MAAATLAVTPAFAGLALGGVPIGTTANDDGYGSSAPVVLEDVAFSVPAPGVLANDATQSGEAPCIVNPPTSTTQGGTVSLAPDGSFTYTSAASFAGPDSFTYGIADPGTPLGPCPAIAADTATVSLTVTAVNDAPAVERTGACAGGSVTVNEDSGAYASPSGCVAMDPGPANEGTQGLSAWLVETESSVGFAAGPSISAEGVLTFRPAGESFGTATLSIRARDTGGTANGGQDTSAPVQVTITVAAVPDAPVAAADTFIALKDRTLNIASPGVLGNDTDADGNSLSAVLVSSPVHGVLTLASNGSFSYTPTTGYVGADAFSYRASDGGLSSATRIVSLTVSAVPVPTASPLVSPPPSAEPTLEPSAEVTVAPTVEPLESLDPGTTLTPPPLEPSASPGPGATPEPEPTSDSDGLPLPVLLVAVLFGALLLFAGAYAVPRWLRGQGGEPLDPR